MKKSLGLSILFVLAVLVLTACTGSTTTVTKDNNGQTVTLKSGDALTVSLEGNPTTGYSWQLADYDTSILSSSGKPAYKTDSNLVGSGGMYTYTFKAAKSGTVVLNYSYLRSWEKGVAPADTFSITVTVQ